jgi:predicted Zn-dependent protease with MMP-like domain
MSIRLGREEFERIAEEEFEALPEVFRTRMENVHLVVEDSDSGEKRRRAGVYSGSMLLGLYEGVPLSKRGTEYGMYPVVPDRITLFQKNIEATVSSDAELRARIREVIVHELAHHFGMTEREIREAGY